MISLWDHGGKISRTDVKNWKMEDDFNKEAFVILVLSKSHGPLDSLFRYY